MIRSCRFSFSQRVRCCFHQHCPALHILSHFLLVTVADLLLQETIPPLSYLLKTFTAFPRRFMLDQLQSTRGPPHFFSQCVTTLVFCKPRVVRLVGFGCRQGGWIGDSCYHLGWCKLMVEHRSVLPLDICATLPVGIYRSYTAACIAVDIIPGPVL